MLLNIEQLQQIKIESLNTAAAVRHALEQAASDRQNELLFIEDNLEQQTAIEVLHLGLP